MKNIFESIGKVVVYSLAVLGILSQLPSILKTLINFLVAIGK